MTSVANAMQLLTQEIDGFSTNSNCEWHRNIFMYWNSGLSKAPDIVRLAVLMAEAVNPGYKLHFIDDTNINCYFPYKDAIFSISSIELGEALFSDVLRSYLLCKFGGVWMDASCIVDRDFGKWLEPALSSSEYFLWKVKIFPDRLIMSWFLASKTNASSLAEVLRLVIGFITEPRTSKLKLTYNPERYCRPELIGPSITDMRAMREIEQKGYYPYFTFHYMWNEAARNDAVFAESLENLPELPIYVHKFDRRKFVGVQFFDDQSGTYSIVKERIIAEAGLPSFLKERLVELLVESK